MKVKNEAIIIVNRSRLIVNGTTFLVSQSIPPLGSSGLVPALTWGNQVDGTGMLAARSLEKVGDMALV